MVRVIANLSIHPEVGPDIAKNMEIVELLVQVLGTMTYDIIVLAIQYKDLNPVAYCDRHPLPFLFRSQRFHEQRGVGS